MCIQPVESTDQSNIFTESRVYEKGDNCQSDSDINNNESKARNYVTDLHKEIDIFIKDSGNLTVLDIANSFYLKPSHVKVILNQLIKSGFICKDDAGDKVYYSTNIS